MPRATAGRLQQRLLSDTFSLLSLLSILISTYLCSQPFFLQLESRLVSFESRGQRVHHESSFFLRVVFFFLSHPQRRDNISVARERASVHDKLSHDVCVCVCVYAREREREREIVARSHRHRPANANGSTKVIIASQRGRRNTWPLIIEMSAYLARRWNRVSRAAVPAYTAGVASCSMPRVLKNPPGKSSILALLCPPFLWDDRFNFAGIEARVSDKTGLILGRSPSFR